MSYTVTITEIQQGVTVTANTDLVTVTETSQPISVLINAVEFATGVTGATIDGAGNLIITLSNSTQLDAGQVVVPGTYGNSTVSAFLPIYSGSIGAATEIVSLTANAGAQSNQIAGANAAIVTANTALKAYTDNQITTANTALKNYVDTGNTTQSNQITAVQSAVTGANAAIVTANSAVVSLVNTLNTAMSANVAGANVAIVTANTAMKSYVDAVTTAWTANAGAQANQIAGANAAIVTANVALKGYVDAQITNLTNGAPAILDTLGEIATSLGNNASLSTTLLNSIAGSNAAIVTANTALKSYVDDQITVTQSSITGANAAIVTANTALKGYTDNQISTANTALKAYTDNQITTANTALKAYTDNQITTANTALKAYVDVQDTAINTAWTANAGAQADQIAGANAAIVTANTALKAYTDNQITTANTALKAYTDNQITTANTALKAYVDVQDSAITSAWTANAGVQADAISALQSNAGAQANQIAGANVTIAGIDANLGSFQTYANLTFGTSSYANANVASYLPVYGGTIYALNITGVPGQDLTLEPDGTGDVSLNADTIKVGDNNVDVTITTRGNGNLLLRTHHADTTEGNITLSHGANGNIKLWPNGSGVVESAKAIQVQGNVSATSYFLGDGSQLTNLPVQTATGSAGGSLTGSYPNPALATQSGIVTGVFGDAVTVPQITIAANGVATSASNVSIVFPVTSGFSGNLVGNTLSASGTGRILANASPQANVQQISTYTQGVIVTATPSYTGANLNSANQTVVMATSGNVNFLTSWTAGTRTTIGTMAYLGVTATSANTLMNATDRIRPLVGGLDLNLNGKSWGPMSSVSNTLTPILVNGQTLNVYGTGNVGQAAGIGAAITITPVSGSINAQYVTANFPSISYSTAGAGTTSNIQFARLYTGAVTATGALTVNNAIALHTYSGWTSSNVSLVTNAYVILNEDTRSIIQTNGNIVATGSGSKYGTMQTFNERVTALGSASGVITANLALGSIHTVTATGDITINTTDITNATSGSSFTIVITQDGTGSRLLTSNLKYVGGTKTLSTAAGSIDVISGFYDGTNYLVSLARGFA
jgi:hypothetical protein